MKRILFVSLCTLILAVSAFAQDKSAEIADVKNQIAALENDTPAMLTKLNTLKAEKEDKIDFVRSAYDKANVQFTQDQNNFLTKANNLKRGYDLLAPALANYNQRVDAHNAHQCTETNHDGSCAWYTAEKNQLDANQAQLAAAYAPLDAQKPALQQEAANLAETETKLTTIYTNLNAEVDSWKGRVEALKADWEQHEKQIAALEKRLAELYGSNASCMAAIPPECDRPDAIGPDGKPLLNGKCEGMVAQCRRMFDGSKP